MKKLFNLTVVLITLALFTINVNAQVAKTQKLNERKTHKQLSKVSEWLTNSEKKTQIPESLKGKYSPNKLKMQAAKAEGVDWWEPDTIILTYYDDWDEVTYFERFSYTYNSDMFRLSMKIEYLNEDEVWENIERGNYTYDNRNNLLVEKYEYFENSIWKLYQRTTCSYDNNNNILTFLAESEDWESGEFRPLGLYTFTYDNNNNVLSVTIESWDDASLGLIKDYRYTNTYDSNNNRITQLSEHWNKPTNSFVNASKATNTYTDNLRMVTTIQTWSGATWQNSERYTLSYDANRNLVETLGDFWSGSWVNMEKEISTYDDRNNLLKFIYQFKIGSNWKDISISTYTYDGNNNQLTYIEQELNGSNIIENVVQDIYTYDNHNNLLSTFTQWWDSDINDWEDPEGGNYQYDANHNAISGESMFEYPSDLFVCYNNMKMFELFYGTAFTATYIKGIKPVEIKEMGKPEVKLIVSNKTLRIELENNDLSASFQIYDMMGKKISAGQFVGKTIVNINQTGTYIARIITKEGTVLAKKVVVW